MSQYYGNCVNTRRLRRNFLEPWAEANGVARKVWRRISLCIGWITSLKRGVLLYDTVVNVLTVLQVPNLC